MRIGFEGGTLILEDLSEAAPGRSHGPGDRSSQGAGEDSVPGCLPGVLWDPRVRRFRAPAWRRQEVVEALRERGVAPEWEGAAQAPLPPELLRADALDLRPYQQAALFAWERADRRGLVALPTGSGKTWVALAALASLRVPTLVAVPTRVLLHQWRRAVARVWEGEIGQWGDGRTCLAPVTVATFESAWRRMPKWGDHFGLLVLDEAHHFGGEAATRLSLLEMCTAEARLGLSATPAEPGGALEALLGPVVYRARIAELAGGYLAPLDRVSLYLDLTEPERRRFEQDYGAFRAAFLPFRARRPGAPWSEFLAEAGRSEGGRRALAAWRASRRVLAFGEAKRLAVRELLARHREERVLVFTPDNQTAYHIAREHLIMPITCDIGRGERDRALERFRRGELRALVSSRVLNEGLDVPDAEVGILVGGTQGPREYVQRLGRVLRPAQGKRALVYELYTRSSPEMWQARRREASLGPLVAPAP